MTAERRKGLLIVLGSLLATTAIFFTCFEKKTVEVPVGYSREAIENDYLALGRLLERMGHPVVTLAGIGEPDPLTQPLSAFGISVDTGRPLLRRVPTADGGVVSAATTVASAICLIMIILLRFIAC